MDNHAPDIAVTVNPTAEMDRLGDEIAELSAHLEAATARLLDRIREFDARGGWNTGFRSCAHWLSWRVGLDPGAARDVLHPVATREAALRRSPVGRTSSAPAVGGRPCCGAAADRRVDALATTMLVPSDSRPSSSD
jgi:hypothetical protein